MRGIAKLLFIILVLVVIVSVIPMANAEAYSGTCGGEGDGSNLIWSLDIETGALTISGSGIMKDYSSDNYYKRTPWYGYRRGITTVSLPDGVTHIGDCAFDGCNSLTSVTIPDSVTSIGEKAFMYCQALTSIIFPKSISTIEKYAFSRCSELKNVFFLGNDYHISDTAFDETIWNDEGIAFYGNAGSVAQIYAEE